MARRPYTGRTTSDYGPRTAPMPGASTYHYGLDGVGEGNYAPEDGVVIGYGYAGGWGNRISFRGDSGEVHYLAHNAPGGLLVPVGSRQREGTRLGVMGMTGTATGRHVHWETRPGGGLPRDPEVWLRRQRPTAPAGDDFTPIPPETPDENDEDDDMARVGQVHYDDGRRTVRALFVPGTAYWLSWTEGGAAIANGFSTQLETKGSTPITKSMFDAMARAAAKLAPRDTVTVEIVEVDESELAAK